jgi:cell division transport system permease protein
MLPQRLDLPFEKDALGRFLPWLIAFMVFLAAHALAGVLVISETVGKWDTRIGGTLTVQVPPVDGPPDLAARENERRLAAVLDLLAATPGIARAERISDAEVAALLQPWLGTAEAVAELPLPRLIDVSLDGDTSMDVETLTRRLNASVPGVLVDDHRTWLERLVRLSRSLQALAGAVFLLTLLATVGTVVFTTRTGLAVHREAIEVLHLIGAHDVYIARQFAWRALLLGLRGGLIGVALAVPTLLAIGFFGATLEAGLLPDLSLSLAQWAAIAGLPLAVAALAMVTARATVMQTLASML